jgi:hypothetical protein
MAERSGEPAVERQASGSGLAAFPLQHALFWGAVPLSRCAGKDVPIVARFVPCDGAREVSGP